MIDYNLVAQHAPIVRYHSGERYFMYDIDEWYKTTTPQGDGRSFPTDPAGNTKPIDFVDYSKQVNVLYRYYTEPDGGIHLSYFLFFAYNGPKMVLGVSPVGEHEADLEQFEVYILPDQKSVGFYGLSSHGDLTLYDVDPGILDRLSSLGIASHRNNTKTVKESVDLTKKLQRNASGRPIVYAAVNSHALYHAPGSYIRFYGFGNDECNNGKETSTIPVYAEDSLAMNEATLHGQKYIGSTGVGIIPRRIRFDNSSEIYTSLFPPKIRIPTIVSTITYVFASVLMPFFVAYTAQEWGDIEPTKALVLGVIAWIMQPYMLKHILHEALKGVE